MQEVKVFSVHFKGIVRYESLSRRVGGDDVGLSECQALATDIYNNLTMNPQRIIPDIFEVLRMPVEHPASSG